MEVSIAYIRLTTGEEIIGGLEGPFGGIDGEDKYYIVHNPLRFFLDLQSGQSALIPLLPVSKTKRIRLLDKFVTWTTDVSKQIEEVYIEKTTGIAKATPADIARLIV